MIITRNLLSLLFLLCLPCKIKAQQPLEETIERIYQAVTAQETLLDSLSDFTFIQHIHFKKLDSDDEIDEQSKRTFLVKIHQPHSRERELISAYDFEDGNWIDVTEKEKSKKMKGETRSQEFSLLEMVGPAVRDSYQFKWMGEEPVRNHLTIHLRVDPLQAEEDKFRGDLWINTADYGLVKAILIPSDFPAGVSDMVMIFNMIKVGPVWLPEKISFDASISFLFIFKGKIRSEICFSDYKFEQGL